MRNVYILVRKHEGKRPHGRPSHRRKDNIQMDLKETGYEDVDLIDLTQDRNQWRALVNTLMNIRFPYKEGNFLTS